jgi:hypothetical protein
MVPALTNSLSSAMAKPLGAPFGILGKEDELLWDWSPLKY